jgi:hypothetical protein
MAVGALDVVDRCGTARVEEVLPRTAVARACALNVSVTRERVFDGDASAQACSSVRRLHERGEHVLDLFAFGDAQRTSLAGRSGRADASYRTAIATSRITARNFADCDRDGLAIGTRDRFVDQVDRELGLFAHAGLATARSWLREHLGTGLHEALRDGGLGVRTVGVPLLDARTSIANHTLEVIVRCIEPFAFRAVRLQYGACEHDIIIEVSHEAALVTVERASSISVLPFHDDGIVGAKASNDSGNTATAIQPSLFGLSPFDQTTAAVRFARSRVDIAAVTSPQQLTGEGTCKSGRKCLEHLRFDVMFRGNGTAFPPTSSPSLEWNP